MKVKKDDRIVLDPSSKEFERLYIDLRSCEKRIYTDEEVAWLPDISEDHVHRKEWEIRKASAKKFLRYLVHKNRPLKILEVGCGNGWLSYQLSTIPYFSVTGIDINLEELQQAERVFAAIPNLNFSYGDIGSMEFEQFDLIVFAAAIQYFPSFSEIIETASGLLNDEGEIHLIDSHFYSETEVKEAEKRSHIYFHNHGFDGMCRFYFHHSLNELKAFNFSILYDPKSRWNRIFKKKNPFYWIHIKK
jgi:ubiquinone/menaquinone biosynthesis C-methylase UbiE